jgi:hypothetical protein
MLFDSDHIPNACALSGTVDFVTDVGQGGDEAIAIPKNAAAVVASVKLSHRHPCGHGCAGPA